MLKVVGASWLQTRISTYILIAVALFGIGAIILSEFGHVEKDGTYAATVSWNRKGGYRIDFWGQGNNLNTLPLNVARAYYKTGIFETGWSIIEIETSSKYPDTVQAYAAGLLEGSLTWQLIHHHWYNTVGVFCEKKPAECRKLKRHLRENAALVRERAELLESNDSFWHMVIAHLFYAQLDGMKAGWRFAVRRSRQSFELQNEDFLWLAMASDLPELQYHSNDTDSQIGVKGMTIVKALPRENLEPLIVIGHNTVGSYIKMLRLLKKYTFNYHSLPTSISSVTRVPGQSVVMSSYPGALSSQDEFYMITGENQELVVAGTPLLTANSDFWNIANLKDQVMSPIRVMASNRLATDSRSWSRVLAFKNSGTSIRQWISYEPRSANLWLIEQLHGITHAADFSKEFADFGVILCTGVPHFQEIKEALQLRGSEEDTLFRRNEVSYLQENVTTIEEFKEFLYGGQKSSKEVEKKEEEKEERSSEDVPPAQVLVAYRREIERASLPWGVIDSKILAIDRSGLEMFQATSGPPFTEFREPFKWSKSFPNVTHMGQPEIFNFQGVTPMWVWN